MDHSLINLLSSYQSKCMHKYNTYTHDFIFEFSNVAHEEEYWLRNISIAILFLFKLGFYSMANCAAFSRHMYEKEIEGYATLGAKNTS